MRKSGVFFSFIGINLAIIAILCIISLIAVSEHNIASKDISKIVKVLQLTDMVLATDARYTRNPSQADLFSAFQDYPGSIEHFPTGSVIPPPDMNSLEKLIEIKANGS
ncbi:MAG: hypothetical protein EPN94_02910 [Nitrospirae bacterium]|nr:MAG: hypothetical protein EPN94_02910 [Nitrospirota bacterium]